MDPIQKLKQALQIRIKDDPDNYFADSLWEEEIEAVCQDLTASIHFIQFECTDEELYWLGEVFDDIMDKIRNVDFLNCLRRRAQSVINPEWKADILEDIRTAAEYIIE